MFLRWQWPGLACVRVTLDMPAGFGVLRMQGLVVQFALQADAVALHSLDEPRRVILILAPLVLLVRIPLALCRRTGYSHYVSGHTSITSGQASKCAAEKLSCGGQVKQTTPCPAMPSAQFPCLHRLTDNVTSLGIPGPYPHYHGSHVDAQRKDRDLARIDSRIWHRNVLE
jgi:hypothetical protein